MASVQLSNPTLRPAARVIRAFRSAVAVKLARYAAGSVVALGTSVVVFALLLDAHASTITASVLAFVAGAIPNWVLNRRWAWQQTGKVEFAREIVGYLAVSLLALVASAAGTGLAQSWLRHHVQGSLRVALVTAVYVAVQAALFAVKYLIYERWVFAGRSRVRAALRSRHQVLMTARANRTP